MIGRPRKCRHVCCRPVVGLFKPPRVACAALEEVVLASDEIEALRLADLEGLYHADAACQMRISRQTFGKIVAQARRKVASALIGGKALRLGEACPVPEKVTRVAELAEMVVGPAPAAMLE